MNDELRIRAHHVLCILGFRGEGYSREFVENMRRVVDIIRANPQAVIQIVDE